MLFVAAGNRFHPENKLEDAEFTLLKLKEKGGVFVEVRMFCTTHWWLVLSSAGVLVTVALALKTGRPIKIMRDNQLITDCLALNTPTLFMYWFISIDGWSSRLAARMQMLDY